MILNGKTNSVQMYTFPKLKYGLVTVQLKFQKKKNDEIILTFHIRKGKNI